VTNPTAFFKQLEKEKREEKEKQVISYNMNIVNHIPVFLDKDLKPVYLSPLCMIVYADCLSEDSSNAQHNNLKCSTQQFENFFLQERAASENAVDDQIASSSSTSSSASLRGSTPSSSSKKVVVKKKPSRVLVKKANGKQFIKERPKLPTAPTEMVEPENHEERPLRRKCPQRGPRIDYTETDDDHFLCK
jgi:hypothetical protein